MANKQFTGYLRDPLGDYANNDKYRFTHVSTTGEVIKGSTSYFNVDDTGFYDFTIEYGNVTIESCSELGKRWINQGTTTINADTVATTLPALLNALVPASDPLLIQLQALLADAENAADRAEAAAANLGDASSFDVTESPSDSGANKLLRSIDAYDTSSRNYHDENVNLTNFSGGVAGAFVAFGYMRTAGIARFLLPISKISPPSSVTVTGTFSVSVGNNVDVINGVIPIFSNTQSSKKLCIIDVGGISGASSGDLAILKGDSPSSNVKVN